MSSEHGGAEPGADDRHVGGEAEIGELFNGCRPADAREQPQPTEIGADGGKRVALPGPAGAKRDSDEEEGDHIEADDDRRPAGAGDAEGTGAEVSVEEGPIGDEIDQVGGDERDGDEEDAIDGLEIATKGPVEEKRGGGPDERVEIVTGLGNDLSRGAEAAEQGQTTERREHDEGRSDNDEPHGLGQGAGAVLAVGSTEGLRDEGLYSREQADGGEGDGVIDGIAERRC